MSKLFFVVLFVATLITFTSIYKFDGKDISAAANMPSVGSIYEISASDIDGKNVNLGKYKGKVLLFVNTASKCGYTPQYKGLQAIYDKYKECGFVVLGFPSNDFGGQEPGTEKEIKEFCTFRYKVTFPMFAKINVKGDDKHPLYKYLTSKETNLKFSGEVTWNFNKFLVSRKGKIIDRFSSRETPESKKVINSIEKALER